MYPVFLSNFYTVLLLSRTWVDAAVMHNVTHRDTLCKLQEVMITVSHRVMIEQYMHVCTVR